MYLSKCVKNRFLSPEKQYLFLIKNTLKLSTTPSIKIKKLNKKSIK